MGVNDVYKGSFNRAGQVSAVYTDGEGNHWSVTSDGLGSWNGVPQTDAMAAYGIASPVRARIAASDKDGVAEGIDDAVYRWKLSKQAPSSSMGWLWLALGSWLIYESDRKGR